MYEEVGQRWQRYIDGTICALEMEDIRWVADTAEGAVSTPPISSGGNDVSVHCGTRPKPSVFYLTDYRECTMGGVQMLDGTKGREMVLTSVPVMLSGWRAKASWEALQISCTIKTLTAAF